ncbi:ASKHA domain-containing protein [Desulfolithobacter sp.]
MDDLPLVTYVDVTAEEPSLQDNTADIDRLRRALVLPPSCRQRPLLVPYGRCAEVAAGFRAGGFRGTAVVNVLPHAVELVDFLPSRPQVLPGMALDLGTTHLEATLIDLLTGERLGHGHAENQQIRYGADILSRIHYATSSGPDGRDGPGELQAAVIRSITSLATELTREAGLKTGDIRALSVSGNTTMVHLLLKLSPYHICREPYIPLINAPDPLFAEELGLGLAPRAPVWILPSIGSYFGGDLISGILASGLDQADRVSMLIDVGTNAEVVLGNREWLIACAGAAGPALEGGVAKMGMRAGPGAVEHVHIDTDIWKLSYRTIDNAPPVGICGSGMIDLVAELYLARIIDLRGKFRRGGPSDPPGFHRFVEKHLITMDGEPCFVIAPASESGTGEPVVLSQVDLDAMMRSKAAMYAILTTLTGQVGVRFEELDRIYVAGAFGKHINPRQAIVLGMLPDLPLETYQGIGNSSLKGAELVLLQESARRRSLEIGQKITYIELNVNQDFMICFSGSRFIPHTDPSLFPSVPVFRGD